MEIGDIVKFRKMVDPGDDKTRMRVLEIHHPNKYRPEEARVEAIVDMPIRPQNSYPTSDLEVVPNELMTKWIARNCRFAQKTPQKPRNGA
jgi:hypothetical protein